MKHTTNYNLKKPEEFDFYDVNDQNTNWDVVDAKLKTFDDYVGGKKYIEKTLNAGSTTISFTDDLINTNTKFDFYTSKYGVSPIDVSVGGKTVTLTFDAQDANIIVGVSVNG